MVRLERSDLDHMERLTNPELVRRWEGMQNKMDIGRNKVTIANTGLFSSGKSSLFNALLGRVEDERFPVGAVPTTKKGDREILCQGVEIIDTPGIDATADDDRMALNMLMESDIIIMTHNVKMGMLNQSEYSWLKDIAGRIPKKHLPKRLLFVCTWIDEAGGKDECKRVVEEVKRQINMAVGQDLSVFQVSAKRFYTGRIKHKEALEQASNIPQFKEYLITLSKEYEKNLDGGRLEEVSALCMETRGLLEKRRDETAAQCRSRSEKIESKYVSRLNIWNNILENFSSLKSDVENRLQSAKSEGMNDYGFEEYIKDMR